MSSLSSELQQNRKKTISSFKQVVSNWSRTLFPLCTIKQGVPSPIQQMIVQFASPPPITIITLKVKSVTGKKATFEINDNAASQELGEKVMETVDGYVRGTSVKVRTVSKKKGEKAETKDLEKDNKLHENGIEDGSMLYYMSGGRRSQPSIIIPIGEFQKQVEKNW